MLDFRIVESIGLTVGAVHAKCRADQLYRHQTKTDRDRRRSVLGPRSVLGRILAFIRAGPVLTCIFFGRSRAMMLCRRLRPKVLLLESI
jgi:hypothetical protein